MREIEKILKLSDLTDWALGEVKGRRLSPEGASIIAEAITNKEISVDNYGEVWIPIRVIKKILEGGNKNAKS